MNESQQRDQALVRRTVRQTVDDLRRELAAAKETEHALIAQIGTLMDKLYEVHRDAMEACDCARGIQRERDEVKTLLDEWIVYCDHECVPHYASSAIEPKRPPWRKDNG